MSGTGTDRPMTIAEVEAERGKAEAARIQHNADVTTAAQRAIEHPPITDAERARNAAARPAPAPTIPAPVKSLSEAAPSGAEHPVPDGFSPPGQGDQVILTGDAQAAARGGIHESVVANTAARDAAIMAGHVAPGTTLAAAVAATSANVAIVDLDPAVLKRAEAGSVAGAALERQASQQRAAAVAPGP